MAERRGIQVSDFDCYCDDGVSCQLYEAADHIARKEHKCYECSGRIMPGEVYERVRAIWEGDPQVCKTCIRCLALREFVKANVKCFCWYHGNTIEDAIETARHYHEPGNGLLFGALRRLVAIRRHKQRMPSAMKRGANGR